KWIIPLFVVLALLATAGSAEAQLSVSGSPSLLRITAATAGSSPVSVSNAATAYTIAAVTGNPLKVTGQLKSPMPSVASLMVSLAAPPGATSVGPVQLDATARDLVTGIILVAAATRTISYQFSATPAAGVVPMQTRTVTFTLTAAP